MSASKSLIFFGCYLAATLAAPPKQGSYVFDLYKNTPPLDSEAVVDILTSAEPGVTFPLLHSVPDTGFDCDAQANPGYYADPSPASRCQAFYRCEINGNKTGFLCPNSTLFNQLTLTCDYYYNVDCQGSQDLYKFANSRMYQLGQPLFDTPPKGYITLLSGIPDQGPQGTDESASERSDESATPVAATLSPKPAAIKNQTTSAVSKPTQPPKTIVVVPAGSRGQTTRQTVNTTSASTTTTTTTTTAPITESSTTEAPPSQESTEAVSETPVEAPKKGSVVIIVPAGSGGQAANITAALTTETPLSEEATEAAPVPEAAETTSAAFTAAPAVLSSVSPSAAPTANTSQALADAMIARALGSAKVAVSATNSSGTLQVVQIVNVTTTQAPPSSSSLQASPTDTGSLSVVVAPAQSDANTTAPAEEPSGTAAPPGNETGALNVTSEAR